MIGDDRRRVEKNEKLNREVQVLINIETHLFILEECQPTKKGHRPRPVSDWIREAITEKIERLKAEREEAQKSG